MYFDPQHYIGTIFIEPNSRNPLNPDLEPDPQKNWKSGVSGTFFLNFPRCSYLVMKQLISAENSSGYCSSSERTCSGCSLYTMGMGPMRPHSPSQTAIWTGQASATTAMLSISKSGFNEMGLAGKVATIVRSSGESPAESHVF